jgi:glycosyltransferase involved in cell wall biosynthesis
MGNIKVHRFRYAPEKFEVLAYGGGISTNLRRNPLKSLLVIPLIVAEFFSTMRLVHKEDIDLIHAHWIIPQGLVAVLVSSLSAKHPATLVTAHGADVYTRKGKLISAIKRFVLNNCDRATVVSQGMAKILVDLAGKTHPEVIPMGADLSDCFYPDTNQRFEYTLATAGRLVEKKGIMHLIEAFAKLLDNYPDLRLIVAGDGPERGELEKRAGALGIRNKVHFSGGVPQQDLARIFQQATIAVFPFIQASDGDQEGFGLVVIEAMGCECATVASDLPAIRDIVMHNKNGLLIDQQNPENIVSSVSWLLEHADRRKELAMNGRSYVLDHFDWKIITRKYMMLYKMLTGN